MSGHRYSIIFGPWQQVVIIGLYTLILILGLVFNAAIIWVILGKSKSNLGIKYLFFIFLIQGYPEKVFISLQRQQEHEELPQSPGERVSNKGLGFLHPKLLPFRS